MEQTEETTLMKSIIDGYDFYNNIINGTSIGNLSNTLKIDCPYGMIRNFCIKAICMINFKNNYNIDKVYAYKYPLFRLKDGNTFTLHYFNIRNKLPNYITKYLLHSNETINLFSRQEMSKQHFIVYYYGKNKLENLALHRAFLEENQAKSQLIKTMSIDRDIFVDKENLVGEPQFEMKSKEENIEKIKEKIGLLCNKHA